MPLIKPNWVWIFLFLFPVFTSINAQEPFYYNIGDEKGFPIQQVFEVLQDKKGHLWFGANSGLFEFDGKEFIHYQSEENNSGSVSNLCEDSQGRIWARNFRGQIFHTQGKKLLKYLSWEDSIQQFPSILIDTTDHLFLTSYHGIYRHSLKTKDWVLIKNGDELNPILFNSASLFPTHIQKPLVVSLSPYAGWIDKENFIPFNFRSQPELPLVLLRSFESNQQLYLLDANNNVYSTNADTLIFVTNLTSHGLTERAVFWITDLKDGHLAFATRNGLFLFDYNFEPVTKKPFYPDKKISCVLKDYEGNIWLTTLHHGIMMIPNMDVLIYNKQNSQLPENSIYSIELLSDHTLFLGFANGMLGKLSPGDEFQTIYKSKIVSEIPAIQKSPDESSLYFVNWSKLFHLNKEQKIIDFQGFLSAPKEIKMYSQNILIPTNTGIGWISSENRPNSLFLLTHCKTEMPKQIKGALFPKQKSHSVSELSFIRSQKKASSVELDTLNHRLWGIFNDGIFWFKNQQSGQLLVDSHPVFGSKLLMGNDYLLWIASSKNLLALNDTHLVYQIPTPSSVLDIYITNDTVWFATVQGVFGFNKRNHQISTINKFDGIASLEVQDIKVVQQKMYLATPKGLVTLHVDKNYSNPVPPIIEIKNLKVIDKDTLIQPEFKLKHHENMLQITLNAISYRSHGSFQYKYRLLGTNDDWITIPAEQSVVRFHSLASGKYRFEVKAINEDGIESIETKTIQFQIKPPFWKTVWFAFIVLAIITTGVYVYIKIRIKNIKHRNELQQLLKASEITAIKAQMNPHFIFNALNSIQDLILQSDFRASNVYLGKFSDLLRQVLEMSGKEMVSLDEELKILEVYLDLEKLRFSTQFNFELTALQVSYPADQLLIPSMVIQPFVENAIKHGLLHKSGSKKLTVQFSSDPNQITCRITDNGVGRAKAGEIKKRRDQHYRSFASSATSKRIDLYNELNPQRIVLTINDLFDNGKASGTEVILQFPVRLVK